MQRVPTQILQAAISGDADAFRQIYACVGAYVYTIVYRILNNKEDAEEITQDVFVTVHRSLPEFQCRSSFETWVYRIAVNAALNRARKRAADVRTCDIAAQELPQYVHDRHVSAESSDTAAYSEQLLQMLPPEQRACLVLRHIDDLTYAEIAETLEISINTVRSRLRRARENVVKNARHKITMAEYFARYCGEE